MLIAVKTSNLIFVEVVYGALLITEVAWRQMSK
jgi:hypothetical protein